MHKVLDGRDIYYLANLSDSVFDSTVALRGKKRLEIWDPHTGEIASADSEPGPHEAGTARRKSDCVRTDQLRCFW